MKKRHFSWTALSQVGAKQLSETENLHGDAILLVPGFQKVDRTLNIGLISIYWVALLISLYFSNCVLLYIDLMNRGQFLVHLVLLAKSTNKKRVVHMYRF